MRLFVVLCAFVLLALPLTAADATRSATAIRDLRAALEAKPAALADLADKDFAKVALTKADAATANECPMKAGPGWQKLLRPIILLTLGWSIAFADVTTLSCFGYTISVFVGANCCRCAWLTLICAYVD